MKQPIIFSVIVCIACAFISGIATGQVVEKKWPFSKPGNVNPPAVEPTEWVRNGIDAYILAKLQEQGLKPAPEAAKRTLIRRI